MQTQVQIWSEIKSPHSHLKLSISIHSYSLVDIDPVSDQTNSQALKGAYVCHQVSKPHRQRRLKNNFRVPLNALLRIKINIHALM